MKKLALMASDETLYTVLDAVRGELTENGWSEELITPVIIVVEEVYVNIAHYAYDGAAGEAEVTIDATPEHCRMIFKDRGKPYNPLEREDPDITLSAEERSIGGLGIYLMKEIMDHEEYMYQDGQNILTIEKKNA